MEKAFEKEIDNALCREFLSGRTNPYSTQLNVKVRLLKNIIKYLRLNNEDLKLITNDENYIHPECSVAIANMIDATDLRTIQEDEKNRLVQILSSDANHDWYDLLEMSDILNKYASNDPDKIHTLNTVFAVDGFNGFQYRDYADNLRYPCRGEDIDMKLPVKYEESRAEKVMKSLHVEAVRKLYEGYGKSLTPSRLHNILVHVLGFGKVRDFVYTDLTREELEMGRIYEDAVGGPESIRFLQNSGYAFVNGMKKK